MSSRRSRRWRAEPPNATSSTAASPTPSCSRSSRRKGSEPRSFSEGDTVDTKTLLEWSERYHVPTYSRAPICLVRGEGVRVWDSDGREYLDFTAGIGVVALGHCHPRVTGAIREAAGTLIHVSNLFHTAPQTHLARFLCENSFGDRVFFCNSGAEANGAAFKLARRYCREHFASDRYEIIAMRNSFHGRTLATVTATGQEKYRQGFEPLMPGFKHGPFNDLRAVERALDNRTAAVLLEPVQGEGGVNVPDDGYLPGLRKLCDEAGALLILDEAQTGLGWTGTLWGDQHWGVEPDIMTLLEEKLPERAARVGRHLMNGLAALKAKHSVIREVRGKGLLIGIELSRPAAALVTACREAGLLALTAGAMGPGPGAPR